MKRKIPKVILSLLLVLSFTLSSMGNIAFASNKSKASDIENMLKNLTAEQRAALEDLYPEENTKLRISPEVNLNSEKEIDLIVQFNVDPAEIQVIKGKVKGQAIEPNAAKKNVEKSHKEFKNKVNGLKDKDKIKIKREYKNAFNGVSMSIPGNQVTELTKLSEVKAVWVDEKVKLEPPAEENKNTSPMMDNSLPFIGVDKLHAEKITGKGIKVGVLDTGIDYNHPDFKDVYKGGYDFVDNDNDPMETTYADWVKAGSPGDYHNYVTSHGTHVAGTIAGQGKNNSEYAVKGVAPGVDLYAYRVLGIGGSGTTSGVIAGIDRAVAEEMDVMNLSLGAGVNDPLFPTSIAINNAVLQGVVACVAAGNFGPKVYTLGSPGTSPLAITVGASDVAVDVPTVKCSINNEMYDTRLLVKNYTENLNDLIGQTLNILDAGLGMPEDFNGKDFNGKAALIKRGGLGLVDKVKNAKAAGAKAVILWNNVEGTIPYYLGEDIDAVYTLTMTMEQGQRLKDSLNDSTQVTFNEIGSFKTEGDKLADFSSCGPVGNTFDIKPDVTAPGVDILSTAPYYINSKDNPNDYLYAYQRMSGTSMATPHVAGIAALILQEHKHYSPSDVKTALMNTAADLKGNYSVYQAGAGRVDAYRAVHSDVKIQVMDKATSLDDVYGTNRVEIDNITGSMSFGYNYKDKDEPITESKKVIITNNGSKSKEYKVSVDYISSEASNSNNSLENGVVISTDETIKVGVHKMVEFSPSIKVPANAKEGIYEGYVRLVNTEDSSEKYQIPFAIMVGNKGANVVVDRKAFTTDTAVNNPEMSMPCTFLYVKVKSPLKSMDLVVKDGATDKYLGILGSFYTDSFQLGVDYLVPFIFPYGRYYPFTGDPANPIDKTPVEAPQGYYKLELIAEDENGETYKASDPVFIDNTPPELTMNPGNEPGIYEIEYNEKDPNGVTWFEGKVYDSNVDLMKANGVEKVRDYTNGGFTTLDQGQNAVIGYAPEGYGSPTHYFQTDSDGSFKFGVTPEEVENIDGEDFWIYPVDYSTCGDIRTGRKDYSFVKKGKQYSTLETNKTKVTKGDEFTLTLSVKYAQKLLSQKYTLNFIHEYYQFVDAKINPAFAQYAQDNNLSPRFEVSEITPISMWKSKFTVGAFLDGSTTKGLDGEMPVIDVTFKVINDQWHDGTRPVTCTEAKYTKLGDAAEKSMANFRKNNLWIVSKNSIAYGNIQPEAFLSEDGQGSVNKDVSNAGCEITAISPNGETYKGNITSKSGAFEIKGLPVYDKPYKVVFKMPGHFDSIIYPNLSSTKFGYLSGVNKRIIPGRQLGGDVNGDNVIDITDAVLIANYIKNPEGTAPRNLDIRFDGKIDDMDMGFVIKNYLKVNPMVTDAPAPKDKTEDGKVLADILKEMALWTPPALSADTTDNIIGKPIDIKFTDNFAWRGAIKDIKVDGISVKDKCTVSAGKITIDGSLFTEAKTYAITVNAEGYQDAAVNQTINTVPLKTPPALAADTTDNIINSPIDITFKDDAGWRGAIKDIKVNGTSIMDYCTLSQGKITIKSNIFKEARNYEILVNAEGYQDASVIQMVNDPKLKAVPPLTGDTTDNIVGNDITILFEDNADWRNAITDVSVDGTSVTDLSTTAEGSITIKGSIFKEAKNYTITVKADGYNYALVVQTVGNR